MAAPRRFDYDEGEIHQTYRAGRALSREQVDFWSTLLQEEVAAPPRLILDLGCGVGRYSGILRALFGATVVGLDRSSRMLTVARIDPALAGIRWLQGSAEALPVRDASVDLLFLCLVYHHLADRPAALEECCRTLT